MPHIVLEYTDNIEIEDTQALLKKLADALIATGHVRRKGIRARAIKLTDYLIADGDPAYHFLYATLSFRVGRTPEILNLLAESVVSTLEAEFAHLGQDGNYLAVANDIHVLQNGIALNRHNLPAERIID